MKFLLLSLLYLPLFAQAAPAPRSKLPIMGWSSWNHFRIHIDDGFFGGHDAQRKLISHEMKIPSGMKALAD